MYYCLSFYPALGREVSKMIDSIRSTYDPTAPFYKPHVTLIFPTHDRIGEIPLIEHIECVLRRWKRFTIRFGGFHKTPNHWLLLGLSEGEDTVKRLYRELHTGILADGRDLNKYAPHLGLGLFVKDGVMHDWFNPLESNFDSERYEEALELAKALPLSELIVIDKLSLGAIPDSVVDWVRGRLATIPEDSEEMTVREFSLSH